MEAPDYLSPTHLYRVAFERGARIVYGDRSHYFISGTASIDAAGNIVHPGNVKRQTVRTLENMRALMERSGGSLSHLKQAVVYLRDWADRDVVECALMDSPLAHVPAPAVESSGVPSGLAGGNRRHRRQWSGRFFFCSLVNGSRFPPLRKFGAVRSLGKIGFRHARCRAFNRIVGGLNTPTLSRAHFFLSACSLVQEFRFGLTSNGTVDEVGNLLVGISGQFDIFPYQGRISRKIFYQ